MECSRFSTMHLTHLEKQLHKVQANSYYKHYFI